VTPLDVALAGATRVGLDTDSERRAPHLSSAESELLLRINEPIPATMPVRFDQLVAKRDAGMLSADEHAELLTLVDEIELRDADRIAALADLAQLRGISLEALMEDLSIIHPATHA
jgi:hypothetical protein